MIMPIPPKPLPKLILMIAKNISWKEIGKEAGRTAAKKGVERAFARNEKSLTNRLKEVDRLEKKGSISKEEAKRVREKIIDNAYR